MSSTYVARAQGWCVRCMRDLQMGLDISGYDLLEAGEFLLSEAPAYRIRGPFGGASAMYKTIAQAARSYRNRRIRYCHPPQA